MSSTLEDQVSFAGEIELTDAQLMAVFGGNDHGHGHSYFHSESKKTKVSKSVKVCKTSHEHFGFSLDMSINLKIDECEKEVWEDSNY